MWRIIDKLTCNIELDVPGDQGRGGHLVPGSTGEDICQMGLLRSDVQVGHRGSIVEPW